MDYIGEVVNGRLRLISPKDLFDRVVDLTRISMQTAADPLSSQNKIDLSSYEGRVVAAEGRPLSDDDDLIWDAKLVGVMQPLSEEMINETS
jgi:hypothetical protein